MFDYVRKIFAAAKRPEAARTEPGIRRRTRSRPRPVAFGPKACRAALVRGLVLISLTRGPGAPRLVLGSNTLRGADLLFMHQPGARRAAWFSGWSTSHSARLVA